MTQTTKDCYQKENHWLIDIKQWIVIQFAVDVCVTKKHFGN